MSTETAGRLRRCARRLVASGCALLLATGAPLAALASPTSGAAEATQAGTVGSTADHAGQVLRVALSAPEGTLDPAMIFDAVSSEVASCIFETLLTYDYLARPARLVPLLAESMPEQSADGLTLVFHLRRDVQFASDPAFGDAPRPLRAADVVFSFLRVADPAVHSPFASLLEGRLQGLDALVRSARTGNRAIDYGARIPGIEALDEHTVRMRLVAADPTFLYVLPFLNFGIQAPEVVQRYGSDLSAHPVGTGPYRLTRWMHGSALTLEANPGYRERHWDFDGGSDPGAQALARTMRGRRIPAVPRIEIRVIEEGQAAWLAFQRGELDILELQSTLAPVVLRDGALLPQYQARGYQLSRTPRANIFYQYINLGDPMLGGMDEAHVALRRAILLGSDETTAITVISKGQSLRQRYPIPPGVIGEDPDYRSLLDFDPATARALLDVYGFRPGADGWRRQPDGGPLVIHFWRTNDGYNREYEELFQRNMKDLGLRVEGRAVPFPELMKSERGCQVSSRIYNWVADYPDGDDFMLQFFGPNAGDSNAACYRSAGWDALYRESRRLAAGVRRDALYHRMARQLEVDGAVKVMRTGIFNYLLQPGVQGFHKQVMENLAEWPYVAVRPPAAPGGAQ